MNSFSTVSITSQTRSRSRLSASLPSILVATDGSATSLSAYNAADLIAARYEARVHVLSVLRPFPVMAPPPGSPVIAGGMNRADADATEKVIRTQLAKISRSARWTVETRAGAPAAVIARVGSELSSDLIVVGESHHGRVDRLLGEETSVELARRVNLPLLIASRSMCRLPRRVVIAFGLTSSDFSGLAPALEILGGPPSVSCVHVQPRSEFLGVDWAEYDGEYRSQVEVTFDKMKTALTSLPGVHPDLTVLHGDPVTELNAYADSVKAELIVLGVKSRRAGSFAAGSGIAMKMLRSSNRSVLLIPEAGRRSNPR